MKSSVSLRFEVFSVV